MRTINKSRKGFTLVEIMIVVVIIGLLAAMAIPAFNKVRETSQAKTCVNNLRQIASAKDQWALETGAASTATPTTDDLVGLEKYIKGPPACPRSGTYGFGAVNANPTCSVGDPHILPGTAAAGTGT